MSNGQDVETVRDALRSTALHPTSDVFDALDQLQARLDAAEAENERLRKAIRRYVAASPFETLPDDQLTDEEAELVALATYDELARSGDA